MTLYMQDLSSMALIMISQYIKSWKQNIDVWTFHLSLNKNVFCDISFVLLKLFNQQIDGGGGGGGLNSRAFTVVFL